MRFVSILYIVSMLVVSCKSETKKETIQTSDVTEASEVIENPVTGNSSLPKLFRSHDNLFLSWTEKKDTTTTLFYSTYKNGTWTPSEAIISGTDWFVNWADFPAIAENNGTLLTSFLQKSAKGTYTYDIKLNVYPSEEKKWNKNLLLHNDGTKSEHGFVSMLPSGDTSFFVTWLDGRNTMNGGGHDAHSEHGSGAMTLRSAIVDAKGTITERTELDARICDCCQTSAAQTENGPVVVYRDRSETEIRDVSIVRFVDGTWTQPQTIGNDVWEISGCPVNGPSVSSLNNNLAIAWFTAVNDVPKVQVVFSENNGESFGMPIQINNGFALGRVDVAMISNTAALVSWMETVDDTTLIKLVKVTHNGVVGAPKIISKTSAERASGFPQLEVIQDTAFVVWTAITDDASTVKIATQPLNTL
ncbi:hypothetical protein [Ulvibacter litoralis]|uniref:BNR repeat-containing family member n=1 Tax=Ulvibacter litoralis TaxID=227084 RepID=A0A1G7ITU9_9FLAO|nr:hypothetical protein [Ulvibacter litoralis]SDF16111.1 hypothetical protein SAMN05421855_10717 [Ulvibacter litoralis]